MTGSSKKKNNRVLQSKTSKTQLVTGERTREPNCIVTTRGNVSMDLRKLSQDVRRIMEPNTSVRLENTKDNAIRDFVAVSAQLDMTHLILFTQTSSNMYLKLCRLPHGPTITFKIVNYTRTQDVASLAKKQYTHGDRFLTSPCIMTNLQPNVGNLEHQATARMFLDMFPTITPKKASPHKIKRCCLFHYDPEKNLFDLRHYAIRVVPVEVCKGLKKLMGTKVPDLGKFTDVSELITKSGMLSDSEAEDDPNARVTVPHLKAKKKVGVPLKSSVRLHELGPRLTLELYKVENGLLDGQVLYHSFVEKTDKEKLKLMEIRRAKKKLKLKRKQEQEDNVEEKKKSKLEHKKKCLAGMGMSEGEFNAIGKRNPKSKGEFYNNLDADDEDDDAEYYRKEVGEEPDPDVFSKKRKSLVHTGGSRQKKFKKDFKETKGSQPFERKKNKMKKRNDDENDFRKRPGRPGKSKNKRNKNDFEKRPRSGKKIKNLKNVSKKMTKRHK